MRSSCYARDVLIFSTHGCRPCSRVESSRTTKFPRFERKWTGTKIPKTPTNKKNPVRMKRKKEQLITSFPSTASTTSNQKKIYSHNKVRTSTLDRTIDSMFPVTNPAQTPVVGDNREDIVRTKDIPESECILTSVRGLRTEVRKGRHNGIYTHIFLVLVLTHFGGPGFTEILSNHTFVGIVDLNRSLSLIQHSTKLYLVNHASLG